MAATQKSGIGKIVLIVVGILLTIGLLCCGIGYYFIGAPAIAFGRATQKFNEQLVAEFGAGVRVQPLQRGPQNMLVGVGFPEDEELTPEHVAELQDRVWELYTEAYVDGGFPFCTGIAIGHGIGANPGGYVTDWEDNVATVEEMEERTGVSGPPASKLTRWVPEEARVRVQTEDDLKELEEFEELEEEVPRPDTPDNK